MDERTQGMGMALLPFQKRFFKEKPWGYGDGIAPETLE